MELLISGCAWVLPDGAANPVSDADILVRDGEILQVGRGIATATGASVLDARGCVAMPGLVNTHHHLFQSLTRAVGHDQALFGWLASLWPRWMAHDAVWLSAATMVGCAELLLSGCTTVADHHYLPPTAGADPIEAQAAAARTLGIRLLQAIGSMDISAADGGLAPAEFCESADTFASRAQRAITTGHDRSPGSMRRIAIAPCHPLAVSEGYVRQCVELARDVGVPLHTHIAEARGEEAATLAATGRRPLELLEGWGLLGPDVWLAHGVHLSDADVTRLASTGTGVATCPSSNLRLGSGIARTRTLLDTGVRLGLGVDGSASNDSGNLLAEARQLLLASRAGGLAGGLSVREALTVATAGGAAVLGWPSIGRIAPGYRADIAVFPVDGIWAVGTQADPVAGLLLSPPPAARHVVVEGEIVVRDGSLVRADLDDIVHTARSIALRMVGEM